MEIFKADWGVLGKTSAGKEISHIFFCIDLAIQAQARPIPLIQDGRYMGTFISGYGFLMTVQGTEHSPVSFASIVKEIEASSIHTKTLEAILKLLGKAGQVDDGLSDVGRICRDQNFTMMSLHRLCLESPVSVESKAKIQELARHLDFRQVTWGINSSAISGALNLITDVAAPLENTIPLHHSQLFSTDRLELVWSCFGFVAPSFRPVSSQLVEVTAKTFDQLTRKGNETTTETRKFDFLHVRPVKLDIAISDLKDVRSSKKVGILRSIRRESTYADRRFDGKDFNLIIEGLTKLCAVSRESASSKPVDTSRRDLDITMDDDDF